ncbi:DUF1120 domain-containing protein [Herbaspirillum sp. YR522]|uniref:DUF1120 domain-containing protein n=1 Tax=Herbaspirillum sp. YR522 TaxID=1144342 RepID=UPI00026F5364|nr:DUF1120 domain-containing protein [Herbaspirillum sp. YR522]EJN08419.1 Protein of unknown function (DUF1120) [Herbaspirillum sp. YR522]
MRRFTNSMAAALAACLLPVPGAAERVATARLEVKGAIIPPACSIVLEQGGIIEYGGISLLAVPTDKPLHLARKTFPITLNCSDPAHMLLKVRDERLGTAASGMLSPAEETYLFGLGEVAGKKLGGFKLSLLPNSFKGYRAASRAADDLTVLYAFSDNVWNAVGGGHFRGNGSTKMSFAPRGSTTPGAYVTVSGEAAIETWINKRPELPGGQRLELAGSVVLELYYN